MKTRINIETLPGQQVEIVERKGIGHPDTVCDEISEAVSRALCRYYLQEFGAILHHNVDKALLVGGQSKPQFGGGVITKPIELYIAGRATRKVGKRSIPVDDIARQAAREWISTHFRFLDPDLHVRIIPKIRPGSSELVSLFTRFAGGETPLANDTSYGTGYYPLSPLEAKTFEIESWLNAPSVKEKLPFAGEDIKVMGIRDGEHTQFTVAIAMVDRFLRNPGDYQAAIRVIRKDIALRFGIPDADIAINAADDYTNNRYYLTVSGTSAESGDDGQVGRGNRANGLITPYRPMSLEALTGKNPVSHVGKIYNLFAPALAQALVEEGLCQTARISMVSRIGAPIDEPQLLHICVTEPAVEFSAIEAYAAAQLRLLPEFWKRWLSQG